MLTNKLSGVLSGGSITLVSLSVLTALAISLGTVWGAALLGVDVGAALPAALGGAGGAALAARVGRGGGQ